MAAATPAGDATGSSRVVRRSRRRTTAFAAVAVAALAAAFVIWSGPTPRHPGWTDPKTGVRLVVEAVDEHPFLRDHGRILFIVAPSGRVRRVELYTDGGTGLNANVYRLADDRLVVVDANGVWITVTRTGEIESRRWCWGRELPERFVGCFRADGRRVYRLVEGDEPDVYLFKDPPDGIERGV